MCEKKQREIPWHWTRIVCQQVSLLNRNEWCAFNRKQTLNHHHPLIVKNMFPIHWTLRCERIEVSKDYSLWTRFALCCVLCGMVVPVNSMRINHRNHTNCSYSQHITDNGHDDIKTKLHSLHYRLNYQHKGYYYKYLIASLWLAYRITLTGYMYNIS